ncbi:hypothetical protein TKK_0016668 [Trichogramma kaykai]
MVNRPGRWPTPNGSRRPTRGKEHDGDAGHDAATACQRPRPPTSQDNKSLNDESPRSIFWVSQPGVVRERDPWTTMCVRNVDDHVSCSSQVDGQLAAFFIDLRAK